MVKAVATEVVKEAMKPINTGSFIVTDHEKKKITEQVKKELELFNKPVDERIRETVRKEVANIINGMYDGNKMREFIDLPKLSAYVTANMFKEDAENAIHASRHRNSYSHCLVQNVWGLFSLQTHAEKKTQRNSLWYP